MADATDANHRQLEIPDVSDLYLCRASGEGTQDFRVCADEAAVFAFYEEMAGRDQDDTLDSITKTFADSDYWSCEGRAFSMDLYCAKFEVWKVDPNELVTARPEAQAQEPNDEQLWRLVRAYHGWETDDEMVEAVGYNTELYIERMRRAVRESRLPVIAARTTIIEECAKVCDTRAKTWGTNPPMHAAVAWSWRAEEAENCAAAIRRLGMNSGSK